MMCFLKSISMKVIYSLAFIVFFYLIFPHKIRSGEWELIRSSNNINVYSRSIENQNYKELRAVTAFNAPLPNVVAMIKDVDFYPQWVYRCSEARILKTVSETEFYYYHVTSLPWPFKDRDLIVHVMLNYNKKDGSVSAQLNSAPGFIAENMEFVRVKVFKASWKIYPLAENQARVMHDIFVDAGVGLPGWIVNRASHEGPYQTIKKMREFSIKDRFAHKNFDFLS
jgi:ribosome-associated toxin RatA of RatAB toxin-antitoxin module